METQLKYLPVLRLRQEEQKVLTSFNFGRQIYPLIEIIKEVNRKSVTMRKGKKVIPKTVKTFESVYREIINKIKSEKVFIDLPVHMDARKGVDNDVLSFLQTVVFNRTKRTEYMIKLKFRTNKVIPVISTYSQRSGEINTITLQEKDLRPHFPQLAYRTFPKTFNSDMSQIMARVQKQDYLILDLDGYSANPDDEELESILEKLSVWDKCHVTILRPAMGNEITNSGLKHDSRVEGADNSLLENFHALHGDSFGDYAGIKKDAVSSGGVVSPGFIFYDAIENDYYGYKGKPQLTVDLKLDEYGKTIIPAVISSSCAVRMKASGLPYLDSNNEGWQTILEIERVPDEGRSAAKFKRISMLHYLHCMQAKIANGDIR